MFSCLVELFPGVSTRPRTNLCTVEKCVLTVSSMAVQSLTHVWLLATPWTAGHQALLSFTSSGSLSKFTSIESVTLSNHLILCQPFLLLPSIFPSIRVKVKSESCSVVSDSLRSHGLYSPWNSPGQNTGAFPFSRGSSPPWDQTHVSLTAGGCFTSWATSIFPSIRVHLCY